MAAMKIETARLELSRMAPVWQPRGMAIVCFAAATMLAYTVIFPINPELDGERRLAAGAATLAAGVIYWVLARRFRVWMVHVIVVNGFSWGVVGLCTATTSLEAALNLTTLLWTCVFVGAAFRPRITRVYAVLICVGIVVGMTLNGVDGNAAIGFAFAGSFVVTMEILSRATSQLRHEATTDSLTGLLNRTGLEREVNRVRTFGRDDRIAVLVADLDGFKAVNDRQGHQAGDRLLRKFAAAWREGSRVGDILARIGGDEFVAVFPEVEEEAARAAVERLRAVSPAPWSGGLVIARPGEALESCMGRADRLLYREKQDKRAAAGAGGRPGPDRADGAEPIAAE